MLEEEVPAIVLIFKFKFGKTYLMKHLLIILLLLSGDHLMAQKVFSVQYANQADVKVYVVKYESEADLKVYKVKYASEAGNNDGKWFFVDYANQAGKKIFFVDYESQADLKVFFVNYSSEAGWKNNSKKQLMY